MADNEAKLDDLGFDDSQPDVVVKDMGAAVPESAPQSPETPPETPPAEPETPAEPEAPAAEPETPAAEPEPESGGESPDPPSSAAPGETVEQLQARLATIEQERESERQGFIRQLGRMRQRAPEQPVGQVAPEPLKPPDKIPVQFDEKGNPFVKPEDLAALQPQQQAPTPEQQQAQYASAHEQMRNRILLEKPAEYAAPIRELVGAYQDLDARLAAKQVEAGQQYPFQSIDEIMNFARMSGVLDGWRSAHPNVAPSDYDVVDLITAGMSIQETPMRRVLDGYLSRQGAAAPAHNGAAATNGNGAPAPSTPPKEIPPEKPRSMAERGRAEKPTEAAKDLPDDFMDWSDEDFEKFKKQLPVKVTGAR